MPVNTTHKEYDRVSPMWKRVRDCYGGRDRMLSAGNEYVPDLVALLENTIKGSTNSDYRKRGSFYNAVTRTVQGMNGHIFQDPPKALDVTPAVEEYLKDVTLSGINLELFAMEAGRQIFQVSRYGIFVEMPPEGGERPYLIPYTAEHIINWRTARFKGDDVLTMVVLHEEVCENDLSDPFKPMEIVQYRVLYLDAENIYRQQEWRENPDKKGEFVGGAIITPTRRGVPLSFIPFVFLGATTITPLMEEPMMKDIADVNIAHWRNSVDFEHGLHLVALPTPWCSGLKGVAEGEPIRIGPSTVWELELQGQAGMLEFTGQGLGSLEKSMDKKERQMATLGARLLEDAPDSSETATGVRMRRSGDYGTIKTVGAVLEEGISVAVRIMAWWDSIEDKVSDVKARVELNKNYLQIKATAQDVLAAFAALQAGKMSFETWYELLRTGGWTRKGVEVEQEREDIEKDKPKEPEKPEVVPGEIPEPPAPKVKRIVRNEQGLIDRIEES